MRAGDARHTLGHRVGGNNTVSAGTGPLPVLRRRGENARAAVFDHETFDHRPLTRTGCILPKLSPARAALPTTARLSLSRLAATRRGALTDAIAGRRA